MTVGDILHRDQALKGYSLAAVEQMAIHWLMMSQIFAGRKIDAIKLRRAATGDGLKEAKDYVEEIEAKLKPSTYAPVNPPFALTEVQYKEVLRRLDKLEQDAYDLFQIVGDHDKKIRRVNKRAFRELPEHARNGD
jgi:hypothetical protein